MEIIKVLVILLLSSILLVTLTPEYKSFIISKVKTIGLHNMKPVHNLLERSFYKEINHLSKTMYKNKDYEINSSWVKGIKGFSKPVFVHTINDASIHKRLKSNLSNVGINRPIKGAMLYFWIPGSYIPWHNDVIYTAGLTIYLNDYWKIEYGGLFQFYTKPNVVETITPSANLGVYQEGGVPHSTTVVAKNAPVRRTLQVFFA